MSRLVGSMGTVALFERLLVALLKQQGIEPNFRSKSGGDNRDEPSETSFCKMRLEDNAWWINFGYDERTRKSVGQITFPYHEVEKFVAKMENGNGQRK